MGKVLVNETSLTSIADAIREKNGTTETYKPSQMGAAIAAIEVGGGEDKVPNPLLYSGNCRYLFTNNNNSWIWQNYSNRIQTKELTNAMAMFHSITYAVPVPFKLNSAPTGCECKEMFYQSAMTPTKEAMADLIISNAADMFTYYKGETIPELNFIQDKEVATTNMFSSAGQLKEIGKLKFKAYNVNYLFSNCKMLRTLPEMDIDFSYINNSTSVVGAGNLFVGCCSLRSVPEEFLKKIYTKATS